MVNQCCSSCNDSSCSGGMSAPVISFLWALQSSQICRQYFVSCCVRLGIALSRALSISASLCGGAKRTVVGGGAAALGVWLLSCCIVGGGSSGSGAGRLRCVDSYSSLAWRRRESMSSSAEYSKNSPISSQNMAEQWRVATAPKSARALNKLGSSSNEIYAI